MTQQRFEFRFATPYWVASLPFGVTPASCEVAIGSGTLQVRFGPWRVQTALNNIADVAITGPYRFLKTAGPAHLSLADRGLTFATNGDRGVCLEFSVPIKGIEPTGRLRHPNLTITVADCDGLAAALRTA